MSKHIYEPINSKENKNCTECLDLSFARAITLQIETIRKILFKIYKNKDIMLTNTHKTKELTSPDGTDGSSTFTK